MSVCECACDLHELQQHGGSKSFTSSRRTVPWLHPRLVCEAFSSLPVGDGSVSCTYRDGGANAFSYLIEASSKNNPSNYGSTKLSCVLLWTLGQSGCAKKTTTTKKKSKQYKKKKYLNGDAELSQGCSGAPKIHAAIQEVNKLKERQKEGGWPLINRRSHALRLSFPTYVCQYCSFGHFFVFIGWYPDGQVPAEPADLALCVRTRIRAHNRFSTFPAICWSYSCEGNSRMGHSTGFKDEEEESNHSWFITSNQSFFFFFFPLKRLSNSDSWALKGKNTFVKELSTSTRVAGVWWSARPWSSLSLSSLLK